MNTLDFEKAKVKQEKLPFHSQKAYRSHLPPLRHYPEEEFTSLWIAVLKGWFGCGLALNLNSWFCFGKALDTRAIGSVSPCHFTQGPLTHLREDEEEEKKVALVTFSPPPDVWCRFLRTLEQKVGSGVLWSIAPNSIRQPNSFRPRLCSYLTKYILYLPVFSSYRNIHLWDSLNVSLHLFHWDLVPVGSTVGTGEGLGGGGCCWNSGSDTVLTSMADTDRAALILQPSWIPEEWTPPCLSRSPLLLSSPCSIPSFILLQGQGETRWRAQQYRLAATHCHKQETGGEKSVMNELEQLEKCISTKDKSDLSWEKTPACWRLNLGHKKHRNLPVKLVLAKKNTWHFSSSLIAPNCCCADSTTVFANLIKNAMACPIQFCKSLRHFPNLLSKTMGCKCPAVCYQFTKILLSFYGQELTKLQAAHSNQAKFSLHPVFCRSLLYLIKSNNKCHY